MPSVERHQDTVVVSEVSSTGIVVVSINRPDKLNALDRDTIRQLELALRRIAEDSTVSAVVLTGAGSAFCAGGDLSEFLAGNRESETAGGVRGIMQSAASLVMLIKSMPQAVVAAINGPAVGGGMALAMAADVRICSESAYFSTAFIKLGLAGFEMGLSVLLPNVIGSGAAFDLAASGGRLSALQAQRLNVVLEVAEDSMLLKRAEAIAAGYAKHGHRSIRLTKKLINDDLALEALAKAMSAEIEAQLQCVHSEENRLAVAKLMRKER